MSNSIRDKLAGKKSKLGQVSEPLDDHPVALNDYPEGTFLRVAVDLIQPNPYQPRQYFDPEKLAELAQSIGEKGVLQPILVRRDETGQIYLVAGERRLRAAKLAGLDKIPAIVTKGHPAEIALIENLQREDLSPVEEAEALARMATEFHYTQEQLAAMLGKAKSTISETLSLNRLPASIKAEVRRAELYPRRLLIEVAKQENEEAMAALFQQIKEYGLKSDEVRQLTRRHPSPRRPAVLLILEKARGLANHLERLELSHLSEADRQTLQNTLRALQFRISRLLND
jgi:ParB family chromosome partitioning protein